MPELEKMVEESRQVYNRLRELQQTFEETTDPYRNQSFRTDILVAFSHAFDLAYDLNRLWAKLADVPHRAEGEFDPVGTRPLHEQHTYEIATPDGVVFEQGTYTNQLHGGICIECERPAPVLTEGGYCESCVLQAMIEQEKR